MSDSDFAGELGQAEARERLVVSLPSQVTQDALRCFCQRWNVAHLNLFGSVVRGNFRADSDVDVLVTFVEGARRTLFDLASMKEELAALFDRPVDLVTQRGIESSRNPVRRSEILSTAESIHVAG